MLKQWGSDQVQGFYCGTETDEAERPSARRLRSGQGALAASVQFPLEMELRN